MFVVRFSLLFFGKSLDADESVDLCALYPLALDEEMKRLHL